MAFIGKKEQGMLQVRRKEEEEEKRGKGTFLF